MEEEEVKGRAVQRKRKSVALEGVAMKVEHKETNAIGGKRGDLALKEGGAALGNESGANNAKKIKTVQRRRTRGGRPVWWTTTYSSGKKCVLTCVIVFSFSFLLACFLSFVALYSLHSH
jgi:hypothetical protein